jgi:hypothetical protein
MAEEMITIPKERYEELVKNSKKLQCLNEAGVDNWEYYDIAMREFRKMIGED